MAEKHVEGNSVIGSQLSMSSNGDSPKSKKRTAKHRRNFIDKNGKRWKRSRSLSPQNFPCDSQELLLSPDFLLDSNSTGPSGFCMPVKKSKDQDMKASEMVLQLMLIEGQATENSNKDEGVHLRDQSRSLSSNQHSLEHRGLIHNSSPSQSSQRLNGHLNTLPASATVNWHSFMEKVYEKFDVVISKVESLEQRLGKLEALLVKPNVVSKKTVVHAPPSLPDGFTFPLKDVMELNHLDSVLFENKITRTRMVRYLAGVGGCGFIDCLRRILKTLMRATVSVKYNLTGVKGKLPFNQLVSLKSTIQDSIRQHYPLATVAEMDGVIAKWLTGSIDRDGNKKKREQEKLKRGIM